MKTRRLMALGVVAALAAGTVGLAGCGSSNSTAGADTSSTAGSTKTDLTGAITVAGSDTMVNLAQAWAEEFMKANPGVQLSVKGGGSGTGIAALLNGTVDFADSSREMKPEEIAQLKAKGGDAVQTVVGRDGITIIVNPSNTIADISIGDLGKVYRGEITNWKKLGGSDRPITLVSRDPSSGTYDLFNTKVIGANKKFAKSAKLLPSTQAIVDEVKANPDAIGYIGVGYESADVRAITLDGKSATKATVLDGSYELARTLNMYSNGAPKDVMKAYVDWILSDAGQKIVTDQGFVTVK